MARGRSKTPTRKAPAGAARTASMLDDQNVTALVSFLVLCACVWFQGNDPMSAGGWGATFGPDSSSESAKNLWPLGGFLLTMHVLNKVQDAGTGFWLGSFADASVAAYAGKILLDVISGNGAAFYMNEGKLTLAFVCWYLTNHNVPFTQMNVWTALNDIAGDIIQGVLRACTAAWNCNLIIGAVEGAMSSSSGEGLLGFPILLPVLMGVYAGAASEFFPLSKGINIASCSNALNYAIVVGTVVATDGFRSVPFVGQFAAFVTDPIVTFVGGLHTAILLGTILHDIFGYFIPKGMAPWEYVQSLLYTVTGVSRG